VADGFVRAAEPGPPGARRRRRLPRRRRGPTRLDLALYAEHFDAFFRHDAWDLLPAIRTPSLLIGGGCDRFTPAHLAERIANVAARTSGCFDASHFG
jgi:pimeloyl-ACP methyl ester carboxylesterase